MKLFVAICLLAVAASARSDLTDGLVYAPGHVSADYYSYPKYAFDYAVKDPHTGDNKAQWEKRDGDVVKGAYSLVEPDGSLRIVEYWADDKSGFNANVKRIGPNVHPSPVKLHSIYKAPIPTLSAEPIGIAPYSIGSIAGLEKLNTAPLISGPWGGAVSTATLIKDDIPIVKAPIISAPIIKPILKPALPLIKSPLLDYGLYKSPIVESLPLWKAPLPLWKSPLNEVGLLNEGVIKAPLVPWGESIGKVSLGPYSDNLIKSSPGPAPIDILGHGLYSKVPIEGPWGKPIAKWY